MTVAQAGLNPVKSVTPNGVTVIVKQTRVTPAVTIQVSVHAGAANDPGALPGLAYFVSRMIDRGTASRTADVIAEELEGRGVSLAARVSRHLSSLVCTCLVEDFEPVLQIIGDCLMQPVFPDSEVATRRGEMITFIRQEDDNPAAVAVNGLLETLYGSAHPYGRRVRGTVESAEEIDRPALVDFHAHHFVPAAAVVVIVGDVEPARAFDGCEQVFGGWTGTRGPALPLTAAPVAHARQTRIIPMMNKSQADIAYGFLSIRRSDPAYHACALMNNVLGEYALGGRLGDSIRERQGMAYYAVSSLEADVLPGPLVIRAGVAASNVERTIDAIDREVAGLANNGPTEAEVAESKQYLIGSLPRTLETNASIAGFLQAVEFFGLDLDYDIRLPQLLQAVSREDVHAAARRLLDPGRATVVVAGPYAGAGA